MCFKAGERKRLQRGSGEVTQVLHLGVVLGEAGDPGRPGPPSGH